MIHYKTGDILRADAEALVNTVNCVGIMGRGIALQFKQAFPDNFKAYAAACARGEVQPGRMFVFETGLMTNPKWCPTASATLTSLTAATTSRPRWPGRWARGSASSGGAKMGARSPSRSA
jgi:O-acetyl-ADP-ribose deacetylase (regulator of RNase III)